MLHCALSRRVVKGELQVPQDRLWLLREMAQATLYYNPPAPSEGGQVLFFFWFAFIFMLERGANITAVSKPTLVRQRGAAGHIAVPRLTRATLWGRATQRGGQTPGPRGEPNTEET